MCSLSRVCTAVHQTGDILRLQRTMHKRGARYTRFGTLDGDSVSPWTEIDRKRQRARIKEVPGQQGGVISPGQPLGVDVLPRSQRCHVALHQLRRRNQSFE